MRSMAQSAAMPVPDAVARVVDQACDCLERAWRAGRSPRLEEALAGATEAERALLFRELLRRKAERECAESLKK